MMARVTKSAKYNEGKPKMIEQPTLFADHSLYEVSFRIGQTEKLTVNVVAENIRLQVY